MHRTLLFAIALILAASCAEALNEQDIKAYTNKRWQMFSKPDFQPQEADVTIITQLKKARELWNNKNIDEAISTAKELLKAYPGSIAAAAELAGMYKDIQAKYGRDAEGLVQSVLASGDGKTPATAYKVITVDEEYTILSYLKLKLISQRLHNQDNKAYDAMQVKDSSGTEKTIYFDVTPLFVKMSKKLQ